jgi:quercetin dioxygenase-like cupin family protein
MNFSRRDLNLLLPALAAASARAQQKAARALLPANIYHSGQIPYEGNQQKKGRRFFYGVNRSGFNMEMHETVLGPGTDTHPPHKHVHEEITILVEGTVETNLEGKLESAEAGSVIYFGSNQMHSVRNNGAGPCRYYVIELRGDEA